MNKVRGKLATPNLLLWLNKKEPHLTNLRIRSSDTWHVVGYCIRTHDGRNLLCILHSLWSVNVELGHGTHAHTHTQTTMEHQDSRKHTYTKMNKCLTIKRKWTANEVASNFFMNCCRWLIKALEIILLDQLVLEKTHDTHTLKHSECFSQTLKTYSRC